MAGARHADAERLTEDDDGDVDRAKHAELVCLLEETVLALWFGYVPWMGARR